MKITLFLTIGILAIVTVGKAQPIPAQSFNANPLTRSQGVEDTGGAQSFDLLSGQNVPTAPIAEALTPEIQTLANGLQNDPVRIFNYVHDHIRHVLYFGSKKGAQLTLLEKSGNDFDQCALLVSLLRAAGYTNAAYEFGWMQLPYDSPDHNDLHHWLQLSLNNTNWNNTSNLLNNLIYWIRGYPATAAIWDTNTFAFQRMWVTLTIGSTNYYLDPSFKVSEPIAGINLPSATGFSSNTVMSVAGGTNTGYSAQNLNEAALRNKLHDYTTNLSNYLQSNYPNASVDQILGGWRIVPSTNTVLSTALPFPTYDWGGTMPLLDWANEPTNLMSTIKISFAGTNRQWFVPELQGQRLTLTFSNNGVAQLWLDDALMAQHGTSGSGYTNVAIYLNFPVGRWNTTNNTFVDTTSYDENSTNYYFLCTNATYGLLYSFEPDQGWLQERLDKLNAYRQQGLADTSRQVVSETLNIMGLSWSLQCEWTREMLAAQIGISHQTYSRTGRMAQQSGWGYYADFYMEEFGDCCNFGTDGPSHDLEGRYLYLSAYFESALEHGIIEQLQSSNLVAASTIKMLQIANTNGQIIYLANSNNWQGSVNISNKLVNYYSGDLSYFDSEIRAGDYLLLPQNGSNSLAGTGSWFGYGYIDHGGLTHWGTIIYGYYSGGQVSLPGATVNPGYVAFAGNSQPRQPPFTSHPTGADPVDMAHGTLQIEETDLSLGQTEPRGLHFNRYYNSLNRYVNQAGMAYGWMNNYYMKAAQVAAPQAGLGKTTPAQMAPMLTATCAAAGIYDDAQPDAKNWTVMALIAKWGVDQLTRNGVSVSLGNDTIQFVNQPNGTFTPPGNCTMTLFQSNSAYTLLERHGRTFKFDASGRMTNVFDQYNQSLKLTYNSSNWVQTATNWKGLSLTFTYSGSPQRLTSVADSTGRSVSYGYNSQGDLASVADPEKKTNTFNYDTNHGVVSAFNALNQLVVSNLYDGFGRVTTQFTQGDTAKMWQILWSGWQNIEQDPLGGQRTFFYDDQTRLTGWQDAMGRLNQTFYDGQNHLVTTVSPLNETNQFIYDGNHNLILSIDPLGFTNQFFYDSQNNLTRSVDARGNTNSFGYNSKFQLTGSTNGAGDFVTYTYNSTDGTLATRADAGGTNSYSYDSYGQLNGITYPAGLGGETFQNNLLGDRTNHINARGLATSFQYNSRRQVTNIIAPTNLAARIAYDAVGNVSSTTDARGFSASNTWSATRQLLATILPATPQGSPVVTNVYDARDWLVRKLNPLQQAVQFTNDPAHHLIAVTDPVLRTTKFAHDADGRQTAATNAALEVTSQSWNARGQVTQAADAAGNTVASVFDAAGNQITLTNRNGKMWQFQFDAANRPTNIITPLNRQTSMTYNNRGLLQSVAEPSTQTANFYYDAKGRLTNRTDNVGSAFYQYDANNNLTNLTENGRSLQQTYDAYDRVSSYRDADGNLIQYRCDADGNLTNLIYPGGKNVFYTYDSLNRLTNVTDWSGRQTAFIYDLASRLTSITRPNGTTRLINYDAAGQTTNIVEKLVNNAPVAFFKLNWNLNATLQWEFAAPLPHSDSLPTRTMTFDDDNRLATFNEQSIVNDPDGNMTRGPLTNDTLASYTYDSRNHLLSAGGLNYAYDPAGNRVVVTNGASVTKFVVNPNAAISRVLMRIQNGVTNYYIYGAGLLYQVTETATATNTLTYHYDLRGSTVALTDDNGNVTDRIEYSIYGMVTARGGTNDTPFLYNGKYGVQTDANGLLYMRARYYNPYLCRFINSDPSGFSGGLNLFAYANGNPASYLDPTGLGAQRNPFDDLWRYIWMNGQPPVSGVPDVIMSDWAWLNAPSGDSSAMSMNDIANALVPGYSAFGDASASFQSGNYLLGALQGFEGAGQVSLFLLTLGGSEELNVLFNSESLAVEVAAEQTTAVSTYRVTQEGETFIRYESADPAYTRITPSGGVTPGTFAAPVSDGIIPVEDRAPTYNLPSPQIPRPNVRMLRPPAGTLIIGPRPVLGGIGYEVLFPMGY